MTAGGSPRVLVVGAGPTGLTAAVELARLGIGCRIVDRQEGPTLLSKAVGISARSLEILEDSGVTDRLLADGIRIRRVHLRFEESRLSTIDFSALPHRYAFLLALPQSETERIMATVLEDFGGGVEWRTALTELAADSAGVDVRLDGPHGWEQARFDHVFGADGVHSAVRQAAGLGFDGYTHDRLWSIADVEVADWPYEPATANGFFHRGGHVGFAIPIGEARLRLVSNTDDALARVPGGYRVVRVLRTDTFHIPVRQAPTYQAGRVALGGDAAHVHSPLGGRGMNLGIEDAACYARRLVEGSLDGYTAERHPVGRRWIDFSERALRAVQLRGAVAVAARNLMLRAVGSVPALQRPVLDRVSGIKE